jgi:hypothetical protein
MLQVSHTNVFNGDQPNRFRTVFAGVHAFELWRKHASHVPYISCWRCKANRVHKVILPWPLESNLQHFNTVQRTAEHVHQLRKQCVHRQGNSLGTPQWSIEHLQDAALGWPGAIKRTSLCMFAKYTANVLHEVGAIPRDKIFGVFLHGCKRVCHLLKADFVKPLEYCGATHKSPQWQRVNNGGLIACIKTKQALVEGVVAGHGKHHFRYSCGVGEHGTRGAVEITL